MGIQGLWRYLDNHNLSRHLGANSDELEPQHLLLDMNSIMHKVYDPKKPTTEATIESVCRAVKNFVSKFPPSKSLTLVFDGVAPTAKLATQRERRRKNILSAATAASKGLELQQGQIVTGSIFVHKCEESIIQLVRNLLGKGLIKTTEPVLISSYHSPGEGDTKLFKRLHDLAAKSLSDGSYDSDDIVVIVGSDCDLVLGCAACTPFHNMFLMSPQTELLTDIGELFTHWMKKSGGDLVPLEMLPSLRIDFVFCVALAGGDHFNGLEDRAIEIWRRYRNLRLDGGFYRRPLVMNGSYQICWDLLTQIVSRDRKALMTNFVGSKNKRARKKSELAKEAESGGSGDVQSGVDLLRGALWSVAAYSEGRPPAMDVKFLTANPKPGSIRVACARGKQHVTVPRSSYDPLPPISVYLGAIALKTLLPSPFDDIVSLPQHKHFSTLTSGASILSHVTQMVNTALGKTVENNPEDLNRTEDDDLLDLAIAAAEASKAPSKSAAKTASKSPQATPKQIKTPAIPPPTTSPTQYKIPSETEPLMVSAPANEWISISLKPCSGTSAESSHINPSDGADATLVSLVVLREATVCPPNTAGVNPDAMHFPSTLNTVDFKYPDAVSKVRISSLIVVRKPAVAKVNEVKELEAVGVPSPSQESCESDSD